MLEAAEAVRHAGDGGGVRAGRRRGRGRAGRRARPGARNLLSFDMGGTTAKASLIRDGQYETTPEYEVGGGSSVQPLDARHRPSDPRAGDRSGRGVRRRRLDRLGRPRRRAARRARRAPAPIPGPVCYGRGGTEPTVTDCDLLLGYLDQGSLLGGALPIDHAAARGRRRASGSPSRSGVDVRTAAAAVIDVVNHAMAEALQDRVGAARPRSARVRAGRLRRRRAAACRRAGRRARHRRGDLPADPRRLLGARPGRHRPEARLRAHGLRHDRDRRSRARWRRPSPRWRREGAAMLDRAGVAPERRRFERSVDARYARQSYELSVPVPPRALDAGGARRDRRGLPRPPPADLRPRQPQRAGAARQRSPRGDRRDPAADGPRHAGAGRHATPSSAGARSGSAKPARSTPRL